MRGWGLVVTALYRSAGYRPGMLRRAGSIHFHVDSPHRDDAGAQLIELARLFEARAWPSKVTGIKDAVRGSHFDDPEYAADYRLHTPELVASEPTFSHYLTALVSTSTAAKESVADTIRSVQGFFERYEGDLDPNSVIEIERVAYAIDSGESTRATPLIVELAKSEDIRFEIHHFADLPAAAPISLRAWREVCEAADVTVGGWFEFEREGARSLRSVKFARFMDTVSVAREAKAVAEIAVAQGAASAKPTAIIEQVLVLWRASPT